MKWTNLEIVGVLLDNRNISENMDIFRPPHKVKLKYLENIRFCTNAKTDVGHSQSANSFTLCRLTSYKGWCKRKKSSDWTLAYLAFFVDVGWLSGVHVLQLQFVFPSFELFDRMYFKIPAKATFKDFTVLSYNWVRYQSPRNNTTNSFGCPTSLFYILHHHRWRIGLLFQLASIQMSLPE